MRCRLCEYSRCMSGYPCAFCGTIYVEYGPCDSCGNGDLLSPARYCFHCVATKLRGDWDVAWHVGFSWDKAREALKDIDRELSRRQGTRA